MLTKQYEIWIADLNSQIGTEPGKTRPVLVVQTNLLNKIPHPSTIICPLTTNVKKDSEILRINIKEGTTNLQQTSAIMIDQIRAVDNKRLIKRIGKLPDELIGLVKENLRIIMDLE
jgi:mRNA interferase MazF